MRSLLLSVAFLSACASGKAESDEADSPSSSDGFAAETSGDSGAADTGEAAEEAPQAFLPDEGSYRAADFRLKEDTCGIDSVAPVTSLMPSTFQLSGVQATGAFEMASDEQGTQTGCTMGALDDETGLAYFSCDSFREGYRSPYGDGFDMEVSFSGEATEDRVVAGQLTVVLHCMVGDFCDEFARSGVEFPCTLGGDLVLELED